MISAAFLFQGMQPSLTWDVAGRIEFRKSVPADSSRGNQLDD